jgi:hypothetical protein
MSLARTYSIALVGVEGHVVEVEVDIANGLPAMILVGLPDTALREARDRIRAAISNSAEQWPQRKITVGLSPASLPKRGSWFDLGIAVVTFDALHTVRAKLNWLVKDKNAHYIAIVKRNQPLLHAQVRTLPWRQVPAGGCTRERGHGRAETRTLKAAHVSRLEFPGARQAIKITRVAARHRHRQDLAPDRLRRH